MLESQDLLLLDLLLPRQHSTTLQLHILISNDSNTLFIHTIVWSEIMFLKYNLKNECVSSVQ